MASVTFSSAVGGDGSTVTDDSNALTGLASGGHRVRFVPALTNTVNVASFIVTKATAAAASAAAAAQSAIDAGNNAGVPLLNAFPVGAIYITAGNTNPATWLGGAWALTAAGRALIGVGTLGTDTYAGGDTGGEARHTLTTSEMPSHSHGSATAGASADHNHAGTTSADGQHSHTLNLNGYKYGAGIDVGRISTNDTGGLLNSVTEGGSSLSDAGQHSHTFTTAGASADHAHAISAEGGGAAHENRMPYLAVYFWQRTA